MKNIWQFIKFGLVGLSNTLISEIIYALIVCLRGHYLLASFTGFVVSIFNAYYWNSRYVFKEDAEKEKRVGWKVLAKTFVAYLGGFVANIVLLALWIDVLHIAGYMEPLKEYLYQRNIYFFDAEVLGNLIAEGINQVLIVPMNYLINKLWAYRQKEMLP